jgi:hypothetical protein
MHTDSYGTYLDPDGRPRPLAGAPVRRPVARVDRWDALSLRNRVSLRWSYSAVVLYPVAAYVAWAHVGWGWWVIVMAVALTLGSVAQVALFAVSQVERNVVERRMVFSAFTVLISAIVDTGCLVSVMIGLTLFRGSVDLYPLLVVLVGVVMYDLRPARRAWQGRWSTRG